MCLSIISPRLILILLMLRVLSGCGYAEWPASNNGLYDINQPSQYRSGNITNVFIGANAVLVGKGDTVFAISKRHRVPMRDLIETNNLEAPFILRIGQRIILPRGKAHNIVHGDTLFGIAKTYDINAFELARVNGLKKPFKINVGDRLVLPRGINILGSSTIRTGSKFQKNSRPYNIKPKQIKSSPPLKRTTPPKSKTSKALNLARKAISDPPKTSKKGFLWPVQGRIISNYGAKAKGLHNDGINIQAGRGTVVRASENGIVAYAGNELRGFGNLLLIKHSGGWVTAYAHNDKLLVKRGQRIKRGQKISTIGSTGNVSSPQLHFEIRRGNKARDPRKLLRRKA